MHPTRLSYRQNTPLPGRQFSPSTTQHSTPWPTLHRGPSFLSKRLQTVADRAVSSPVKKDVAQSPVKKDVAQRAFATDQTFVWEKNWYAVLPESMVDPEKPYGFTLLGKELVLWRDAEQNWRVLDDKCSHRQARLSRGRLSKKDGNLMCGFHGWKFNGEGQCTKIPQAPKDMERKFCSSRRSGVGSYPVQVKQGLIWVWGESSPKAWVESSMNEIDTWDEVPDEYVWPFSEMPMGYHTMMEMFFDLSHVPILHEGTIPGAGENSAVPMDMKVLKSGKDGFSLISTGYMKSTAKCPTTIEFKAPGTCSAVFRKPSGVKNLVRAYYTPTSPGKCRVIVGLKTVEPKKKHGKVGLIQQTHAEVKKIQKLDHALIPRYLLTDLLPKLVDRLVTSLRRFAVEVGLEFLPETWRIALSHAMPRSTKLENQDMHVLLGMDQVLNGIEKKWKRQYFSPLKADVGVMAFRNWLDRYSKGDVKWAPGAKAYDAKSFEDVFDRWNRHTKHCKHCRQTAKDLIGWATKLRRVATVALIASGWLLLSSGTFKFRPCLGALVVAGLSMLTAGKIDRILTSMKSSIPHDSLPGNVDLVYKESTG
ncbi:hypothetical protein BSKO_05650 [Bryopsis sp. KO-2023]|nr:hypothetical protein BSKO_05650 [Bryopsis sp. KO-2023]